MSRPAPLPAAILALLPLAAMALVLPQRALALGNKVWIDCHHGAFNCAEHDSDHSFDPLIDAWEALGAEVTVSTELTYEIGEGDYRIVVMFLPVQEIEPNPDISLNLTGFLSQGGRLILLGDNEDEEGVANGILRDLLMAFPDHDLQLGADDVNPGCNNQTSDLGGDPLADGVGSVRFARVNTVSGGDPVVRFSRSDGGGTASLISVARLPSGGEIVLSADIEVFVANCLNEEGIDFGPSNGPLWENLFLYEGSEIDADSDGYNEDIDCDDSDPYVNPAATEECADDIDNDCDGLADALDSDCAGDDDTTAADDDSPDDDASGFGDDDSTFGQDGGWSSGCCNGDLVGAGGRPLSGVLALGLGSGALLLVRRRRVIG
jgi:hypothetical protein